MVKFLFIVIVACSLIGCRAINETDVWNYNDPKQGGFQKVPFVEQETPPGMVLVEGKSLAVQHESNYYDSLTAETFYISKYQETNGQYVVYLNFIKSYYSEATYKAALPDTSVWEYDTINFKRVAIRKTHYLRDKRFNDYPVVGVSVAQIRK